MANDVKITPNHKRQRDAHCIVCGTAFVSTFGTTVCSEACRRQHQHMRYKARREELKISGCVICGIPLKSGNGLTATCSAMCSSIRRARERERLISQMRDKRPIPSWLAQMDTPEAARLRDAIKRSQML